jgi:hypothetical protein
MLPVCKRIRLIIPKALEVWGCPPVGDRLRTNLQEVTDFENKYTQLISNGKCTLDTVAAIKCTEGFRPKTEKDADAPFKIRDPDNRRARMKDLLKKI